MEIRRATKTDLASITEIYNDAIIKSTATFDTVPKTDEEQLEWFDNHDERHPVLVAEDKKEIIGWASLSRWSDRCAYESTAEVSIYIREDFQGKGVGTRLFQSLIEYGKAAGLHTLVSRIAGESAASIRLHEKLGFFHVGTMKEVGEKFGRLLDVHIMQKLL